MCGTSKTSTKTTNQGRNAKRRDTIYCMTVTLEELYFGSRRYLQIMDKTECISCKYTTIIHGPTARLNCRKCLGSGVQTRKRIITVHIRRGMMHMDKIIFECAAIRETGLEKPGKLIININQKEHPVFKRCGNNLYMVKPLLSRQYGYGCHKTIDGRTLIITNTAEFNHQDIILGEGIPVYGRKRAGALIVQYI